MIIIIIIPLVGAAITDSDSPTEEYLKKVTLEESDRGRGGSPN